MNKSMKLQVMGPCAALAVVLFTYSDLRNLVPWSRIKSPLAVTPAVFIVTSNDGHLGRLDDSQSLDSS